MTDVTPIRRRRGRPSKDDPGPIATRDELLRAGLALLTEKGFSAAGLDEILKTAGVPKGSFYHYFDIKEAFGLALIDEYSSYFARKLDRFLQDETLAPLDRLAAFIADARGGMARHGFRRGCLVGTLGQEMGALPDSFRQRLIDVFADWQRRTALCLDAAQAAGAVSRRLECDHMAEWFWIGWE
jgi:TetR/AcrR family transcriptional repressor of nem operon